MLQPWCKQPLEMMTHWRFCLLATGCWQQANSAAYVHNRSLQQGQASATACPQAAAINATWLSVPHQSSNQDMQSATLCTGPSTHPLNGLLCCDVLPGCHGMGLQAEQTDLPYQESLVQAAVPAHSAADAQLSSTACTLGSLQMGAAEFAGAEERLQAETDVCQNNNMQSL